MCIPKIRLILRVPKNLELIEIHCTISELEHADSNDRRRTNIRLGVQNLEHRTYHSPHWRIEHTPQSTLTHRTHTTVYTGAKNTHHSPHGHRKQQTSWNGHP